MHLLLVVLQAFTQFMKLERKPPVTGLLVLVNALAFFRPGELVEFVPSVAEVCLNPYLCLKVSPAPLFHAGYRCLTIFNGPPVHQERCQLSNAGFKSPKLTLLVHWETVYGPS
jgi:hypothetical protein